MRALLDLVLPTDCSGCGAWGSVCCARCESLFRRPPRLSWPQPAPPGLPVPYSVVDYAGPARALLLAYKERGVVALARPLSVALAAAVAAAAGDSDRLVLVPAPSAPAARRVRGDDVVARLARRTAAVLRRAGADVSVVSALRHARRVEDSSGLGAAARAANLTGAYVVRPGACPLLGGATVVLADDLITTGATLTESARAVRACGAEVIGAAAIAATRRRSRLAHLGLHNPGEEHYGAR